jgi:chromosome segregation ATPase
MAGCQGIAGSRVLHNYGQHTEDTVSTNSTVDGIVTQIRKRIAEENAHGVDSQHENSSRVTIPSQLEYRERMAEDSQRFVDLDTQIEAAARNIGEKPPVPPTWRGRFGSWAIDVLRRLLWWYGAPIQAAVDLLNRRNREQAARHLQMQEQILSLINGLQRALNRTDDVTTLRQEVAGWHDEGRLSRQELHRQLRGLEKSQAGTQSQVTVLTEQVESRVEMEQKVRGQISEIEGSLQKLRAHSALSDSLHAELAQHVSEADNAVSDRLATLESQLRADTEARAALAIEVNGYAERLEQNFKQQIDAVSGRLATLESQLRADTEARAALAIEVNGYLKRLEQSFRGQIDGLKGSLRELQVSNAISDSRRDELAQRISEANNAVSGRLATLETQLRADTEAREASAIEINGYLKRLEQSFRGQIDELKGNLQELRVANTVSDSQRAELAQRISEAAHAVWGRLPVLEAQLRSEIEAREALDVEINSHVDRLQQNLTAQTGELNEGLQQLRAHGVVSDSLRAELAYRASQATHAGWDRLSALERLQQELRAQVDEIKASV